MNRFSGIQEIEKWYGRGGVTQETFTVLMQDIFYFKSLALTADDQLEKVIEGWNLLNNLLVSHDKEAVEESLVRGKLLILLSRFAEATLTSQQLITSAGSIKGQSIKLGADIDRTISAGQRDQNEARLSIQTLETQIALEKRKHKEARSELEGEKGFLNGFLTGLTLGIYNPIKENMDKATQAIAKMTAGIQSYQATIKRIASRQREIRESQVILEKLRALEATITACQNTVNSGHKKISDAYTRFEKAEHHKKIKLLTLYLDKARIDMDRIVTWKGSFTATLAYHPQ